MLHRGGEDEQAVTLVELAIITPVLFLLLFGIVELGRLMNAWVAVQHAAELGARYAVTGREMCSSGGSGRLSCVASEARLGLAHLPDGATAPVNVRSWAYPSYTVMTPNSAGQPCDAVEVEVQYTVRLVAPLIAALVPQVTLTGSQRFLNEPFGRCG
ncbi:MAG: hypothetical protein C4290_08105 [Chloroflexota bacterium]